MWSPWHRSRSQPSVHTWSSQIDSCSFPEAVAEAELPWLQAEADACGEPEGFLGSATVESSGLHRLRRISSFPCRNIMSLHGR
jgi:hypothetical protein